MKKQVKLTKAREQTNEATQEHIKHVRSFLQKAIVELAKRGAYHDRSKMRQPELDIFVEYTPKLATSTYGSDKYKEFLEGMGEALRHHYVYNRHHPEHFEDGIDQMNLVDVLEMVCDWYAATKRHNDGDIIKSIQINSKRFGLSPQVIHLITNTVSFLGGTNDHN